MERRVGIIGAGLSGLLACKYILEKGFNPIVFEAEDDIGGLWRHTIASTKLQSDKASWEFSDFPWPSSVTEENPDNVQVFNYLNSYAKHFGIIPCIKFNSKVLDIDYVGECNEEITSWDLWGGAGTPFGSKGKWHLTIQDTNDLSTRVHEVEFVILCLGKYSGIPKIPEFPEGHGPEVFKGKVLHSMDYSNLDNNAAAELIKGKRVTIIGSQKSAIDIAVECANTNGAKYPCTLVQRTSHWFLPHLYAWGISLGYLYTNRFAELLIHKPQESSLHSLLATLLSPVRWTISKFVESYLKWALPMKKFGLIPEQSFHQDISSCEIAMLPEKYYDKLEEGSVTVKKAQQGFRFCKEGVIINGDSAPIESDLVIFATGYKGEEKLKSIFKSPIYQNYINDQPAPTIPLYRQIIPPKIPQLAVIGYAETLSNLYANEIRSKWLAHFLDGNIKLPSIKKMGEEIQAWRDYMKLYSGKYYWKTCIFTCAIWYNDHLCKDMGCNPKRKKGFFAELFQPYGPGDYATLRP
ncbi:putative flavin-containing monooxygenase [Lupinus albus]|uniref:Flavin-containing monooxygenase n=1 Tax=Lupinus albus TaxID=3870 RepID=A0A6A4NJU6_LUPAL|nr:putative flavin-containing monooxygenase [Lupinus albus]